MRTIVIEPDAWKDIRETPPPVNKPVFLKLSNGRIVLSKYGNNDCGSVGWWVVYPDGDGGWFNSATTAYIAVDASWQPCSLFEEES